MERRDRLLTLARTSPKLSGPPLLYPGEPVLLEVPEDRTALAGQVWTGARTPLIALTILFALLGVFALAGPPGSRPVVLALVAVGVIVPWAGMALWTRSIARSVPPRIYLTDRRLILWNPEMPARRTRRVLALRDLLGYQVLPKPDGTVMLRLFRGPDGSGKTIGSATQALVAGGAIGHGADVRPMLVLAMFGPGPPPTDARLMASSAVFWMKSLPSAGVSLLLTELRQQVPTAIASS